MVGLAGAAWGLIFGGARTVDHINGRVPASERPWRWWHWSLFIILSTSIIWVPAIIIAVFYLYVKSIGL